MITLVEVRARILDLAWAASRIQSFPSNER